MSARAANHRERLALRLLQNWTALHPTDSTLSITANAGSTTTVQLAETIVDDSLTSLTWLQNLNVMKLASGSSSSTSTRAPTPGSGRQTPTNRPTGAVQPIQQQRKSLPHHVHVDPNAILDMTGGSRDATRVKSEPASPSNSRSPSLPRLSPPPPPRCSDTGELSPPLPALQRTDASSSSATKPNHSYATLICMAMNDSPNQCVTLSDIYRWIPKNFPYYQNADQRWQNSIRHNLSLNKCFQRVQREKTGTGKGSYWTINPEFQTIVERDFFRKRPASSTSGTGATSAKKVCRRATVDDKQRSTSSVATRPTPHEGRPFTADEQATDIDEFFKALNDDESLTDVPDALDMSWSTLLGRSLSCPAEQSVVSAEHNDQSATESRQRRVTGSVANVTASERRPATENDAELDELIRACADTDPAMLDDLADFGVDVDSLDLTIHGVGLRPPDWWSSLCDNFDTGNSTCTPSDGGDVTERRLAALNTPSPGPVVQDALNTTHHHHHQQQLQQQQPHPWAEQRGAPAMPQSLYSPLDPLGLLSADPTTPFDSDVADDF